MGCLLAIEPLVSHRSTCPGEVTSPQFLLHNWSGIRQSPETCLQSPSPRNGGRSERLGRVGSKERLKPTSVRINPLLNPQLLALAFIQSHQIHKQLAQGGEPLLEQQYYFTIYHHILNARHRH